MVPAATRPWARSALGKSFIPRPIIESVGLDTPQHGCENLFRNTTRSSLHRNADARSDVGDAVNGLGVGHVISLMRLLDFGIDDAGEIALGVKEVALILSIEIRGINRTGEVSHKHPVARHVEGDAD